ncbi:MAG: hypothetical protein JWL90_1093 [Chthoniobacteraceae bacterium]|nr:hypothetical protein [Chthoniobacteraceae bacterium]
MKPTPRPPRKPGIHLRRSCWIVCTLFAVHGFGAEGPIAEVQNSLRKGEYYSGESTGVLDAETRASLKRFQIHEGLAVTGELDTATLQSLQAAAAMPAKGAVDALKAFDPSVRGRAQGVVQSDKEFLQRMEVNEEPPPPPPPKHAAKVEEPMVTRRLPDERPRPKVPSLDLVQEARSFVTRYLEAAQQATPERENTLYGEEVNYFDSGKVSRKFIERDQQNYYRRWPRRQFTLIGEPEVKVASQSEMSVRFVIRYSVQNAVESGKGETENILRLRRDDSGLKIVSIHERKIRQ